MSVEQDFTRRLAASRKELGISQTELARRMTEAGFPFHQQTIVKIEGNARPVRLAEAVALATIVEMPVLVDTTPEVDALQRARAENRDLVAKLAATRATLARIARIAATPEES